MYDRVLDLRILGDNAIFYNMRHPMGFIEAHRWIHPDVKVNEHVIGRAA